MSKYHSPSKHTKIGHLLHQQNTLKSTKLKPTAIDMDTSTDQEANNVKTDNIFQTIMKQEELKILL